MFNPLLADYFTFTTAIFGCPTELIPSMSTVYASQDVDATVSLRGKFDFQVPD